MAGAAIAIIVGEAVVVIRLVIVAVAWVAAIVGFVVVIEVPAAVEVIGRQATAVTLAARAGTVVWLLGGRDPPGPPARR